MSPLLALAGFFLLYKICVYVHRLTLSPLARFPGPKFAAATSLYEAYYDLVKDGQYPWRIREMHRQYGPVVRVNPREIHVMDADYVEPLFSQRLDKDPAAARAFAIPLASFGTWSHDLHRTRRGAMNRFFSKASNASRLDVIQVQVLKLCDRLAAFSDSKEPVQLDAGFICLTLDVIAQFCYGISYRYLDVPGFDREFKATAEKAFAAGAVNRHFPFMVDFMGTLPIWLVMRIMPSISGILRIQQMVRIQAKRFVSSTKLSMPTHSEPENESYFDTETASASRKATVFEQILDSRLPATDKTEERLVQEGQSFIAAGSETTARALYTAVVYLHTNPLTMARLQRELLTVMPTRDATPPLAQLEKLPYLTAVIKESIRLAGSTVARTSRLSPAKEPLRYKDWVFPAGTPVSITINDVLVNESIFPSPNDFDPMRWLVAGKGADGEDVLVTNPVTEKYFLAFSRGPRNCIGMWLAWAELYMTLAHVCRKFDMELYKTGVEEVATYCERFAGFAKPGNTGVRVKITGLRE